MTTQRAVNIFAILQDKYGSPDLEDSEVVEMLNMATIAWLNRSTPKAGEVNFDLDQNTLTDLQPLIYFIKTTMSVEGVVTESDIVSKMIAEGAEPTASLFRIANIAITADGKNYPATYTRLNDWYTHLRNFFKKGKPHRPIYTLRHSGIVFDPILSGDVFLTVIKEPRRLSLSPEVNPELSDSVMYNVIMIALKLAGVSTRDEELITDIRNTALQISQ